MNVCPGDSDAIVTCQVYLSYLWLWLRLRLRLLLFVTEIAREVYHATCRPLTVVYLGPLLVSPANRVPTFMYAVCIYLYTCHFHLGCRL